MTTFYIDENTIFVGHSCGGGFLVRWLIENNITVKKLILIAPWFDPESLKTDTFFELTIDPTISKRIDSHIFISDDDEKDIQVSVNKIQEALPQTKIYYFQNMGHFTYEQMKTDKFPELLDTIVS